MAWKWPCASWGSRGGEVELRTHVVGLGGIHSSGSQARLCIVTASHPMSEWLPGKLPPIGPAQPAA